MLKVLCYMWNRISHNHASPVEHMFYGLKKTRSNFEKVNLKLLGKIIEYFYYLGLGKELINEMQKPLT